jgi:glutaminyl-tRNA synthetase
MSIEEIVAPVDFVREIVNEHSRVSRFGGRVHTRFPPEPNGYLHIGHAKSINLNYGVAVENGGKFNLRFDDTNPTKEEQEYVDSIIEDARWLGADWEDRLFFASDYFDQLYVWAVQLIKDGKAFVCDLSAEEVRATRGTLTEPGTESPYRNRSVEETLDLFERMRAGEFPDGARTLRAKIDMASTNLNLRDPIMYRIVHATHHRTGDKWCIYPMYDWAHGQSDSIEGITHSICTLEFEDHRPLYDWYLDSLGVYHPQQIEFARLQLTYTLLSKRRLNELVRTAFVSGWDDPRMPTISAYRRRGYTPEAIRDFCNRIGVSKANTTVEIGLLEHCIREDLNPRANRVMVVLRPIRVVIENYPEGQVEWVEAQNNPEDESAGTRMLPFSRELYVEADDYREHAPKGWFRLAPGGEVRLKHAYYITCHEAITDGSGAVTELRCTYDPESRGGQTPDGRRVKGTIHWVSAPHAVGAEVRLYDYLFTKPDPNDVPEGQTWRDNLNPESLERLEGCKAEPGLADVTSGARYQFLRQGYFCADPDSQPGRPVFNRTVGLRDTWAKKEGSALFADGFGVRRGRRIGWFRGRSCLFHRASAYNSFPDLQLSRQRRDGVGKATPCARRRCGGSVGLGGFMPAGPVTARCLGQVGHSAGCRLAVA